MKSKTSNYRSTILFSSQAVESVPCLSVLTDIRPFNVGPIPKLRLMNYYYYYYYLDVYLDLLPNVIPVIHVRSEYCMTMNTVFRTLYSFFLACFFEQPYLSWKKLDFE